MMAGCSAKVVHNQKLSDDYVNNCKIESYEILNVNNSLVSVDLMNKIHQKMKEKIDIANSDSGNQRKINLNIQITSAKIANKTATFFAGAFVGNNELNGFIIIHDHETNNIIGSFSVEIDRNYGGYSAFVNLEEAMADEFANQILHQIISKRI